MNTDESLTLFLLLALRAGGDIGCSEELLLSRARAEVRRELTAPALADHLRELADRKWVIDYKPSIASKRWKLTAIGLTALREENLA